MVPSRAPLARSSSSVNFALGVHALQKKQRTKRKKQPMKTNRNATSRILTLLLAAATLAAYPAWASDQVPFQGTAEGATTSVSPAPAGIVLTVQANGNATHLGQFSREEVVLFNPLAGTLTGTVVFTAANGDQLSGTVAGGFVSPTTATGTYTFTGGTGRFANASGAADFILSTPDGVHFSVTFEGTLSSVGSNNK
jgi:hypothetical protein